MTGVIVRKAGKCKDIACSDICAHYRSRSDVSAAFLAYLLYILIYCKNDSAPVRFGTYHALALSFHYASEAVSYIRNAVDRSTVPQYGIICILNTVGSFSVGKIAYYMTCKLVLRITDRHFKNCQSLRIKRFVAAFK